MIVNELEFDGDIELGHQVKMGYYAQNQAEFLDENLTVLETIEILERQWKIEDRIMRPEHEMLGHTAFLVFCRKF